MHPGLRNTFRALVVGLGLAGLPAPAQTLARATQQPARPAERPPVATLKDALQALKRQFGVDLFYEDRVIDGLSVPATWAAGRHESVEKALENLLKPLGLRHRMVRQGTYLILDRNGEKTPTPPATGTGRPTTLILPAPTPDEATGATAPGAEARLRVEPVDRTLTGTVTDEAGAPLAGVSVLVKGATRGTTTAADGSFSLSIPDAPEATLIFSFVGYTAREVAVGNQTSLNIALKSSDQTLSEVVVTALGIKRDKKALSYATGEVQGRDLVGARETNLANALSAKVAGVQVTSSAGGMAGSSRVVIRGNSSLSGNSQPLYVVDGVPIDNSNRRSISSFQLASGLDGGDGISNLNPNDIESISILKGPNGAALYGQLGANGVILITTKAGSRNRKPRVSYSGNVSVGRALVKPDYQNEYGQGYNGQFTFYRQANGPVVPFTTALTGGIPKLSGGRNPTTRGSWGPRMEGQTYEDMWGDTLQYRPTEDPYTAFFRPERQMSHTISVDGGGENTSYFVSLANLSNDGFVPTNTLRRNAVTVRVSSDITKKLNLDVKLNYINQAVVNRPYVGDDGANPVYRFLYIPRSLSMDGLRRYEYTPRDIRFARDLGGNGFFVGGEKIFESNSVTSNPFWTINNTRNGDTRDRVIGYLKLNYQLAPGLNVQARYGTDFYYERQFGWRAVGTRIAQTGDVFENNEYNKTENADVLLLYNRDFSETWSVNLNAGANHQNNRYRLVGNYGSQLSIPGLYAVGRTVLNTPGYNLVESVINSVYASASVGFRNYLFLDASARNDWSSTLPVQNNSFFYPSVGLSYVASEALGLQSDRLSYLKLRGSWAQAGRSGNPYSTTGYYGLNANTFQGQPLAGYTSTIVDPNLKNELKESYEAGLELRLLRNRVNLDFTYYHSVTSNQILPIVISESTGFSTKLTNAGRIQNKGIELLVGGTPVRTGYGLTWDVSFNMAVNRNKVLELIDGVSELVIGSDRNIRVTAKPGEPYGVLNQADYAWVKDAQGNRLIDNLGLPIRQSIGTQPIGNATPNWTGGLSNTLSYKGFIFSSLIDIRRGGQIFSQGRVQEAAYGTSRRTLPGREGGLIVEGVKARLEGGQWVSTGQPNDIPTTAQAYWNRVASDKGFAVAEEFIYDASYVAIREVRLGYQFQAPLLKRLPFKALALSLYGRNLGYLERYTDGFSPENASINVNSGTLGMEQHSLPLMRTIGIDLNLSF